MENIIIKKDKQVVEIVKNCEKLGAPSVNIMDKSDINIEQISNSVNQFKSDLNVIPDYIETNLIKTTHFFKIPTNSGVEYRSERRSIIKNAYKLMLSKLNGKNFIKNDFLNENVYIIWKESFQKASNNATRLWQTTYAVLKLPEIIKRAKPFDENYRCYDIKDGNQKKNRYVELIKLRYTFNSKKLDYMNFTIELVIGKKADGKNVQYSLEYIKKACS